jgi:DNA-binding Lrp family transcriptional regulator
MPMIYGFVMVQCETGQEQEVYKKLLGYDFIEEVHPLFGEYDFIMRVKADDPNALAHNIIENVRNIPGVHDTKTYLEASFDGKAV